MVPMKFEPIKIPKTIQLRPERAPQKTIPQTKAERDQVKAFVQHYVKTEKLVPPVPFADLKVHADHVIEQMGLDPAYRDFCGVLISNESWRDILATIPFHRRLMLIPVCLRHEKECPAPFDEFGLLCKQCGKCSIHELKEEAERLGYAMLIAEGTPIVLKLIETGQIDAVVGVSCLNVLERVFPYMETAAAPGIAIPLLQDDCADTNIDIDWLWDVIHLTSDDRTHRMDLNELRGEVASWFTPPALAALAGEAITDATGKIAYDWLARDGKRWRPFLTACTWQAYQENPDAEIPLDLKKVAVAVECFHKASLIHDDIEDCDAIRYGEKTLHEEYDVPVALNVGDYLLGEGYRLIAETSVDPAIKANLLHIAALGHRTLSIGQGEELIWSLHPKPMTTTKVLDIFRRKTAPAFEVALHLGAAFAEADDMDMRTIQQYSEALGVAYQIRDDLEDIFGEGDSNDAQDMRPSLLLAMAYEKSSGTDRDIMTGLWSKERTFDECEDDVRRILETTNARQKALDLLEGYKEEAVRSLRMLEHATIKGLLRRVIGKMFTDDTPEPFCHEFTTGNAASRPVVAELVE